MSDRPLLQNILLERVGGSVQTGKEVVGYEAHEDGMGVTGLLSDGSRVEADVIVGSDGIWSKVRQQLQPEERVQGGALPGVRVAQRAAQPRL